MYFLFNMGIFQPAMLGIPEVCQDARCESFYSSALEGESGTAMLESARELSFNKHIHYRDYNYIYIYIIVSLYIYICNKYNHTRIF